MGLDMWFKEDIRNIIMGIALATPRMGLDYQDGGIEFQEGFHAALEAIAVSFGIAEPQLRSRQPEMRIIKRELTSGNGRY